MNKRDLVLSLLDSSQPLPYTPAAFFLHFPPAFHAGQASVDKHLEYFRYTGMDFIKMQYEARFPPIPSIQQPGDWATMPHYGKDFFEGQLKAVEGLVKAAKHETLVIVTLYSAFMCAGQTTSPAIITDHLNREPDKARRGLEIINESLLGFVQECVKLGVDGFYASTQGGEAGRFDDASRFDQYIKPFDLMLMGEINRVCPFNILHVCDYARDYDGFAKFVDYPGHVVNIPLKLGNKHISAQEVVTMFKRPFMGGLERKGVIASGTPEQIRQAAQQAIADAPARFILAADCTVPNDTPWDNLKIAVDTAHAHKPAATSTER